MENTDIMYIIAIGSAILFGIIIDFLKTTLDKKRISNFYIESNYKIHSIVKDALFLGFFGKGGEDFYHVVLVTKSNKCILKTCKTNMFSGVKEFNTNAKILCKNCLSVIDNEWTICPNCNNKLTKGKNA